MPLIAVVAVEFPKVVRLRNAAQLCRPRNRLFCTGDSPAILSYDVARLVSAMRQSVLTTAECSAHQSTNRLLARWPRRAFDGV